MSRATVGQRAYEARRAAASDGAAWPTWANLDKRGRYLWETKPRAPTIYEALRAKLGREPTHRELCADVRRILADGAREMAERGQMSHQRGRVK